VELPRYLKMKYKANNKLKRRERIKYKTFLAWKIPNKMKCPSEYHSKKMSNN
jgi:hypothetical protein